MKFIMKDCPFCGEQPDKITYDGYVTLKCCMFEIWYKIDKHLTGEEKSKWKRWQTHTDEAIDKVTEIMIRDWNTRKGQKT